MTSRRPAAGVMTLLLAITLVGCDALPGRPDPARQELLPSQVVSFGALYGIHCAGCHGADGRLGASRPLNDPVYLALVPRERVRAVIADGIPNTLQPAFSASAGGTLTDEQIDALVAGIAKKWGNPSAITAGSLPPYAGAAAGNADRGQAVYVAACAGCHGATGMGGPKGGAIADASYLSLVTDQYLRTTVIAGRIDLGMPDWRGTPSGQPLTAQQIADVVAWLSAKRRPVPGRLVQGSEG